MALQGGSLTYRLLDEVRPVKVASQPASHPTALALDIRMEAEIETGLGGDDVERVGGGEIGSMELLDVDECFGVCHLNCRYSDTSVCTHYR